MSTRIKTSLLICSIGVLLWVGTYIEHSHEQFAFKESRKASSIAYVLHDWTIKKGSEPILGFIEASSPLDFNTDQTAKSFFLGPLGEVATSIRAPTVAIVFITIITLVLFGTFSILLTRILKR